MNILDIIILICLVPALVQGIRKGFISQANSIISIIAGVWAAARFSTPLGTQLAEYITASEAVLRVTAFAIILAVTFIILGLLARMIEGILKLVMLGWVNRMLGAVFAIIKGVLILGLILNIVTSLNTSFNLFKPEVFGDSVLSPIVINISDFIFPYIKALFTFN